MSRLNDVFQENDVLFGIATESTIKIREQFLKKFSDRYCYIDPYIHSFIGFVDTNLLGVKIPYLYGEAPQSLVKIAQHPKIQTFRKYLEMHPKYDPRYLGSGKNALDFSCYVLRVKRACKAWVEWIVRAEKSLGRIHVLLDDVDAQRIFSPVNDDVFFRAELKKLFKLFFSDRQMFEERIFFWKEGERVNPPWSDVNYNALWIRYGMHLRNKKATTLKQQQAIRTKIYANNPSGEVTSELLLQQGLFAPYERSFVESRCVVEERSRQFTSMSKL